MYFVEPHPGDIPWWVSAFTAGLALVILAVPVGIVILLRFLGITSHFFELFIIAAWFGIVLILLPKPMWISGGI
jgi:hypothetical protein